MLHLFSSGSTDVTVSFAVLEFDFGCFDLNFLQILLIWAPFFCGHSVGLELRNVSFLYWYAQTRANVEIHIRAN